MAHTNSTTNYELSQFIGTDKPTFLGDYNGDMQKIDAAIKASKDTADGASTTANAASALATSASETASTAASAAASADANATTALNTANGATTTANSALSTANSAASTATSAAETASAADTKATAAATAQGTSYSAPVGSLAVNVKEALDDLYAGAGGAHGLYELWVNPAPTSAYSGDTVEVDFDPTTDDAIEVEWAFNAAENMGVTAKRYEKVAFENASLSATEKELTMDSTTNVIVAVQRGITISYANNKATLVFGAGATVTYSTYGSAPVVATNNGFLIPVRVLKLVHNS